MLTYHHYNFKEPVAMSFLSIFKMYSSAILLLLIIKLYSKMIFLNKNHPSQWSVTIIKCHYVQFLFLSLPGGSRGTRLSVDLSFYSHPSGLRWWWHHGSSACQVKVWRVADRDFSFQFPRGQWVNSLAPGELEWNFRCVLFKQMLLIDGWASLVKLP